MTFNLNPVKVLTFKGKISRKSDRLNELFINYSKHYSDLQTGSWQVLIREINYVSKRDTKSGSTKSTFFVVSSNFVRSVNENNESEKTPLIIFEYKNYGSSLFHNPQDHWLYVTDTYQLVSIKLERLSGEENFENFDVWVTVLFKRII